jgi:hypothetical protein
MSSESETREAVRKDVSENPELYKALADEENDDE